MNPLLKYSLLRVAAGTGVFSLWRWRTRQSLRIFAYHGIADVPRRDANFDGFFVSPETFEAHLRTLRHHYTVRPLSELIGKPWPDRAAAITFDDGYADNAEIAAPLLARFGLPATFFVTTGFIDGTHYPWWARVRHHFGSDREAILRTEAELRHLPAAARAIRMASFQNQPPAPWRFMSWDQIRSLAAAGHEIGAHTVSHISLGHEALDDLEQEITVSLKRVQAEVGRVCSLYSYPYGESGHGVPALSALLTRQGCVGGLTTQMGLNAPDADCFALKRLSITGNHDRYAFRALAAGLKS